MPESSEIILGEFPRTLDTRYRLVLPDEFVDPLELRSTACLLAKERPGCLSLWRTDTWQSQLGQEVDWVAQKINAGKLNRRVSQVQLLGRLLSTRHREVKLDRQNRLMIPKEFRDFLGVEPNESLLVVGAGVCIEFWAPEAWSKYLEGQMPKFQKLLTHLSRAED
jgi:MraZ protein